jgi:hypothetical protein
MGDLDTIFDPMYRPYLPLFGPILHTKYENKPGNSKYTLIGKNKTNIMKYTPYWQVRIAQKTTPFLQILWVSINSFTTYYNSFSICGRNSLVSTLWLIDRLI